jgi:hypothetical protein
MNMKLIATVALMALPLTAQAETRAERLTVAQSYIAETLKDMDMERVIQQMWKPIIPQIEASGTKLSEDQLTRIDTLYQGLFMEPMTTMMESQAELMADMMTLEEISALRDFYTTEIGRSVMSKLPDVIGAQQPMILEMVQSKQAEMMGGLQDIVANP